MSELINNNSRRKELLKELILQLHKGQSPDEIKYQLIRLLGKIPYGIVVEAEQELISEGLPAQEVLKLCDIHGQVLKGLVDLTEAKEAPAGHPVHTFQQENLYLSEKLKEIQKLIITIEKSADGQPVQAEWHKIHEQCNLLMDVDKHYKRKENLLFPFLEKYGITGPSTVMWGKDDEVRQLLKGALETLSAVENTSAIEAKTAIDLTVKPALNALEEMIYKEEEILLPMCLDKLSEMEWFEIYLQSDEIGYGFFDPVEKWQPADISTSQISTDSSTKINLSTGSFTWEELTSLFTTLPVDITFVDRDDTVRFFSNNPNRIFDRNRTILGRKVQLCHPPSSVHIVQTILDDFRNNRQNRAAFWIKMNGRFIHIEYFALRNEQGDYLGTMEVSQDITTFQKLHGEQRLLSYGETRGIDGKG